MFVEWVERFIKWAGEFGSPLYWIWVIVCGIIGTIALRIWVDYGFYQAKLLFACFLGFYVLGGLVVQEYQRRRNKRNEGGKK